jgi:hypothetical protein
MKKYKTRIAKLERAKLQKKLHFIFLMPYGYERPTQKLLNKCKSFKEQWKEMDGATVKLFLFWCNDCTVACNKPSEKGKKYWERYRITPSENKN